MGLGRLNPGCNCECGLCNCSATMNSCEFDWNCSLPVDPSHRIRLVSRIGVGSTTDVVIFETSLTSGRFIPPQNHPIQIYYSLEVCCNSGVCEWKQLNWIILEGNTIGCHPGCTLFSGGNCRWPAVDAGPLVDAQIVVAIGGGSYTCTDCSGVSIDFSGVYSFDLFLASGLGCIGGTGLAQDRACAGFTMRDQVSVFRASSLGFDAVGVEFRSDKIGFNQFIRKRFIYRIQNPVNLVLDKKFNNCPGLTRWESVWQSFPIFASSEITGTDFPPICDLTNFNPTITAQRQPR